MKYRHLGGLNNENLLSHRLEAVKSKIKVSARFGHSEAVRESLLQASLLGSQMAVFSLYLSTWLLLLCVCSNIPFFMRTPTILD